MCNILVIGDAMLDTYQFGDTSRVSPEAPVVIVNITKEEHRLGGAANVANNLTSFGISPTLVCAIGLDAAGDTLIGLCNDNGITNKYFINNTKTTHKTRIVARHQQIVRVDSEQRVPEQNVHDFFNCLTDLIPQVDAVIISDYNKGLVCNVDDIIAICRIHSVPVYIDPKGINFKKYSHATLIKPNLTEFEAIYGTCSTDEILIQKMFQVRNELNLKYVLVTLGDRGMIIVDEHTAYKSQEHKFEVVDISGCGDSVIATVAYLLTSGFSIQDSIDLANDMGGLVARKTGTSIVLQDDVTEHERLKTLIKRGYQ